MQPSKYELSGGAFVKDKLQDAGLPHGIAASAAMCLPFESREFRQLNTFFILYRFRLRLSFPLGI